MFFLRMYSQYNRAYVLESVSLFILIHIYFFTVSVRPISVTAHYYTQVTLCTADHVRYYTG